MPTLRQLAYLDALARHRHFGRAADAAAVTQPALSMQIKELEAELGLTLVERRNKGIGLTAEGRVVAARAAIILRDVQDLVDSARVQSGKVLTGPLRLGVIPSVAPYLLPRLLPALQHHYPACAPLVRETQTQTLLEELQRGDLDIVIAALPLGGSGIETLPLFDDPFLLAAPVARADLPARANAQILNQETILLLEEGHCLRDQTLDVCAAGGGDARIGPFGATNLATLASMVANGYGVTLLPTLAIKDQPADPRIRLIPFKDPAPFRTIALAWRRRTPRERDFRALGALLSKTG
ncbi:transcriptional regulator, LysR family [Arboricoccus pini]|uniref:Transcriptional regulator, LysR family n=1 Tax=Arboricoccus pini TaxID=1963835 RepID=A0A212R3W4_9PROT|nr:LysR substrate-binding domain-containing protein [Arboricoccus pini]SNB66710.1 transcriptional regulator, LysR family [Arboricoccus pini]